MSARPQKGKTCLPVQLPLGQQPEDDLHNDGDDGDEDGIGGDDDNDGFGDGNDGDDGDLDDPLPQEDKGQHSLLTKLQRR